MNEWQKAQDWEQAWHDNCINSFHEEEKQMVYAEKMGLIKVSTAKSPHNYNLENKKILDIGGGGYSLLLKCLNIGEGSIVSDPLMSKHPDWVRQRYLSLGVIPAAFKGEDLVDNLNGFIFDEVWLYNVLEHVENPEKIISNAKKLGKVIRIFEWLDTRINVGHIHSLEEVSLNNWLDGYGKVENIARGGANGKCYYGLFLGDHYVAPSSR
jgi:2-polyprenyl-3-methyl-5-hydroxy-6-metoxy-1,4-benzoquinol methylase